MRRDIRSATRAMLSLAAAALLTTGCLTPVDPDAVPVASVVLTFDGGGEADTIPVRGTTRVRAAALAKQGRELPREDFRYASSDTTVAAVDTNGVVRGRRAGTARITATLPEGMSGEATIVVAPSGVVYTIPVGGVPGEMAFSTDYTRLYVVTAPDSLAIVDALGYFRIGATALGLPGHQVAATGDAVYVTHPDADSVSVLSSASSTLQRRIWVGAGPTGIAAAGDLAFVAARYDRRVVILSGGRATLGVPVDGEPRHVAAARNGRRVFATVEKGGAWRLVVIAPEYPDTIQSLPLAGVPTAVTTDAAGDRVYVLFAGASRVDAFAEQPDGRYRTAGSVSVGANANGLSVRPSGSPLVVSGTPAMIVDAFQMTVSESVPGVGAGAVGVRPDGVFAFVGSPGDRLLRVIGL